MTHFASIGLGTTLAPGILWARMQDAGAKTITLAMVTDALKLSGLELHRGRAEGDGRRREPEPDALRGDAHDPHPQRRLAAVSLQRARAGHRGQQDEAAVPPERRAGGEASRQSRGRRVLAGAPSRGAGAHEAGHVGRADRDVSRAAAPLQRQVEQRRHVPRRPRPGAKRSRPMPRSPPASTRGRCTASRGAPRTSSRSRATRRRGDRRRSRSSPSTTTPASSRCCATRARC